MRSNEEIVRHYEQLHLHNQQGLERELDAMYLGIIAAIVVLATAQRRTKGAFDWKRFPVLNVRVRELMKRLSIRMEAVVHNGIRDAWQLSNQKNDLIVDHRLAKSLIPKGKRVIFYDPNKKALDQFLHRKVQGLTLSDRVWDTCKQLRLELEVVLGNGIARGQSAMELAGSLKKYLKNPDGWFRGIRDEQGHYAQEVLHPGRGVYRSSYKNALRLIRTETNMAYRAADIARYRKIPFVLGYEVRPSNNHPKYDVCDALQGDYPLSFSFMGWHPQCRCFMVPVLASNRVYAAYEDRVLANRGSMDNMSNFFSTYKVKQPPAGFYRWVAANKSRVMGWKSLPWWWINNERFVY